MGRHETRSVLFISSLPNDIDLIYGNKTDLLVAVLQVKHSFFDLYYLAAQTGCAATVDVYFLADHSR